MRLDHTFRYAVLIAAFVVVICQGCAVPKYMTARFRTNKGCSSRGHDSAGPEARCSNAGDPPHLHQPLSPDCEPRCSNPSSKPAVPARPAMPHANSELEPQPIPAPQPKRPRASESGTQATPLILQPEKPIVDSTVLFWHRDSSHSPAETASSANINSAEFQLRGKASFDKRGRLRLSNGAAIVEGFDDLLLAEAQASGELTIELVMTSANLKQRGPARIVSFSTDHNSRNFTIGQERGQLILRLRTSENDRNGTSPELTVADIDAEERLHIVISYRSGQTVCRVNGETTFETDSLKGDFSNWERHHVVFGDEWIGGRDWSGNLELLRVSNRFAGEAEAAGLFFNDQLGRK